MDDCTLMVMLSWPELVCAPALAARKQSTQLSMSNAFVPPNLKLLFIASEASHKPEVTCDLAEFPGTNPSNDFNLQIPWPKVQCVAGRWDIGLSCWREV
jgi:hypothetical protein